VPKAKPAKPAPPAALSPEWERVLLQHGEGRDELDDVRADLK
jgi:hypothetical protein